MTAPWRQRHDADWVLYAPRDPDAVMTAEIPDRHHAKQGRAISRWAISPELTVYLKRHFRESWWRGCLARLTGRPDWSAAWQEFAHLKWATEQGFPVPRAVAVGVKRGPGVRLQGYLALEELAGQRPLHELIPFAARTLSPHAFTKWKRGLNEELARLTRQLHDSRHFHKDLYLCHFFAPERLVHTPPSRWAGQLAVIDLHRLGHHHWTWRWWRLKDLAQLLYSSDVEGITARDRVRFWLLYAGREHRRGVLRRLILLRWKNYRGHNQPRRAAA